jgi:hypothetical protein
MATIWNLSYPIITPEQMATYRHHFEALRQDEHVAEVTATERADTPFVMTMRVTFVEGFERPSSQELRHADALFPSQMTHVERDIQVLPTGISVEQAQEALRRLQFELPRAGLSGSEAMQRMRSVMSAMRTPDMPGFLRAVGPAVPGYTAPVNIPEWITIGRVCCVKGFSETSTIVAVRVTPHGVEVDLSGAHTPQIASISLTKFVEIFEPYERPPLPPTAWDRILLDDED